MTPASHAFQQELQRLRGRHRGDVLRLAATFECENPRCAVRRVRVTLVEEHGIKGQAPLRCPRCNQEFTHYIGLEITP